MSIRTHESLQFIWAIELTAPGGGTFMSNGSFKGVNEKTAHFSHRFSNAVRPNTNSHEKKPLPRRFDEEAGDDIGDGADNFEQATALHDCTFWQPWNDDCEIWLILL